MDSKLSFGMQKIFVSIWHFLLLAFKKMRRFKCLIWYTSKCYTHLIVSLPDWNVEMLFMLQRWSKNVYLSKAKSHLSRYPIHPTWDWISLLLMDPIYITNKNSNDFLCSNCLFTEIRVVYFSWDSFSSIWSSLSVTDQ